MKIKKNLKNIVVEFEALIDVSGIYPEMNAVEILNIIYEETMLHAPEINKYRIMTDVVFKEIDEKNGKPIKVIHKGYLTPKDLRHYAVIKQFLAMNSLKLIRRYKYNMQLLKSDMIIGKELKKEDYKKDEQDYFNILKN